MQIAHDRLRARELDYQVPAWANKQFNRLRHIKWMLGTLATKDVAEIVARRATEKISHKKWDDKVYLSRHPRLQHPFYLTSGGSDLGIFCEAMVDGEYDLPSYINMSIDGLPIVDVGGNIGTTTALFASRYPNSPVFVIEPDERNEKFLRLNTLPYGDRITVDRLALGLNAGGQVALANPSAIAEKNYCGYRFSEAASSADEDTSVAVITPSEILARITQNGSEPEIGLLKIDIEGVEKEILESEQIDCLLRAARVLIIETHDRYIPGCTEALFVAAARNGLVEIPDVSSTNPIFYLAKPSVAYSSFTQMIERQKPAQISRVA